MNVEAQRDGRHFRLHRDAEFPGPWVARAECGGRTDLERLFFPVSGQSTAPAKAICRACPVRMECLEFALDTHQSHGIWGGLSAPERKRIVRARRRAANGAR